MPLRIIARSLPGFFGSLFACTLVLAWAPGVSAQSRYTWNESVTTNQWFDPANWNLTTGTGNTPAYPGVIGSSSSTNADIASIGNYTPTVAAGLGIDFSTTNALALGAIQFNSTTSTAPLILGNSSATASVGTMILNGTTLNGIANTVIAVAGNQDLTLTHNAGGNASNDWALRLGTVNSTVQVATGRTLTIDVGIEQRNAGTRLTLQGSGTLILTAANTYSGGMSIGTASDTTSGTVRLSGAGTLGASSGSVTVFTGTLDLNGTNQTINSLTLGGATGTTANVQTGAGLLTINGAISYTGATNNPNGATITGNLRLAAASPTITVGNSTVSTDLTIDGVISGASTQLTKADLGTLSLTGSNSNTFTGSFLISRGTVILAKTGGAIAIPGDITMTNLTANNTNATIQLGASEQIADTAILTMNSVPNGGGSFFDMGAFNETIAGLNLTNTSMGVVWAPFTGSGTLTVNGSINLTPTGGGDPRIAISNIKLDLGGGTRTITVDAGTTTNRVVISSVIQNGGFIKAGANPLALSGANTYTGPTIINAGTIRVATNSVAGVSGALGVNSDVTLANVASAALDLTNAGGGNYNTQIGSLTGGGTTGGNITLGTATLTIAGSTSPAAYAGVISGSGRLVRSGTGTLTLAGTNTYTAGTTISGGTLALGADNVLPNVGTVILSGGTLSTGAANGFNDTVGPLQVTGTGSTITLGSGDHTLVFASFNNTGFTSLTITGWTGSPRQSGTGGKLTFLDTSGLTPSVLANIQFTGYEPGAMLVANELVPVPEPATTLAIAVGGLALGALRRRRFLMTAPRKSGNRISSFGTPTALDT